MRSSFKTAAATALLASAGLVTAVSPYSIDTTANIKKAAATLAWDMLQYYHGNETGQTPGILPGPPPAGDYYWWEGGAMWGTLMDYWRATGDSTYNDLVMQAMQFQVGPGDDYMPPNVTASLGNDDQGFWGMSAMLAAEVKFPDPPSDKPQWLALAQAVFNTQADPGRHDTTCNGGLRWQIPFSNNGYDYKNSIANGCFFNLGARLARYTGNKTYADWAEKTWDWVEGVGLLDVSNYNIYDGAHVETNCTDINKAQFSYNNGVYLQGAAFMYNYTDGAKIWEDRVLGLINSTFRVFFPHDIAVEVACENVKTCTTDMLSFKGYIHRWMSTVTRIAPFSAPLILPVLQKSTQAAITQCTGGATGRECGFRWASGAFDDNTGAGQTMNVLAAVSSLLMEHSDPPVTSKSGGTSAGNPNAGSGGGDDFQKHDKPIGTGDKAGAGILTFIVLASACGMFGWMSLGD
ncbi:hypothetical protein G7046_g6214 [Stylonectria norvegica]|nr:hypothetical protein G7046_g6214 [Stylonectria norvegica]